MDVMAPKYFNKLENKSEHPYFLFLHTDFHFCQFWKRWAPDNDEDPSDKISQITDMKPISIKKDEWLFGNLKGLASHKVFLKNKLTFWNLGNFRNIKITV